MVDGYMEFFYKTYAFFENQVLLTKKNSFDLGSPQTTLVFVMYSSVTYFLLNVLHLKAVE